MSAKLLYSLCLLSVVAQAHEITTDDKFVSMLTVGGRYLNSDADYPVANLDNALETGALAAYKQGHAFDYADVGVQAQWTSNLKTVFKGAYHGQDTGDTFELEQAWLNYDYDIDMNNMLSARVGRQYVALGKQNLEHSHQWQMGVEPLVMRASIAEGWRDDGLDLSWQHENGWSVGGGVFKGESFPSNAESGFNAVNARLGWQQDDNYMQLSLAQFKVSGRATEQQTVLGHHHNQASCIQASTNVLCFKGDSQLAILAAQWRFPDIKTTFNGEAWLKQETGTLSSLSGQVDYTGLITGAWLTANYQIKPSLQSYLRIENLQGWHDLLGTNAALIANEAGISQSKGTSYRTSLGLMWLVNKGIKLSAEYHQQHLINQQSNTVFLLRYQVDLVQMGDNRFSLNRCWLMSC